MHPVLSARQHTHEVEKELKNLKLLLQLISFSITKTFHGLSQMSLIYEANKPSNDKNLFKKLILESPSSVSKCAAHKINARLLASIVNGWLP